MKRVIAEIVAERVGPNGRYHAVKTPDGVFFVSNPELLGRAREHVELGVALVWYEPQDQFASIEVVAACLTTS